MTTKCDSEVYIEANAEVRDLVSALSLSSDQISILGNVDSTAC